MSVVLKKQSEPDTQAERSQGNTGARLQFGVRRAFQKWHWQRPKRSSRQSADRDGPRFAGDGDFLRIGDTRIRLFGIDAPEFDQTCKKASSQWSCGKEAANQLSLLVTGRQVHCIQVGTDQFERVLARCSVGGVDVNRTMVEKGYAVAFRRYSMDYVSAEETAKASKRGLWSGTFQMPGEVRGQKTTNVEPRRTKRPAQLRTQRVTTAQAGCVIKGNHSRRGDWIYHLPGMPYYEQTRPEAIFCSEAEAQAAGYRRAKVR